MRHITFKENPNNKYKIAILIKETCFNKGLLEKHYIEPLINKGIKEEDIIGLSLKYNENKKAPVKLIKSHLETILKACEKLEITTLLVADTEYYKKLTGMSKAEPYHGYVKPCMPCEQNINVILTINYQALFYNPDLQSRLDLSLNTLFNSVGGISLEIGHDIIHTEIYPDTYEKIEEYLAHLHMEPALVCDVETFSLKHYSSGIGTIAFAWNQHSGVAFSVDYKPRKKPFNGLYGKQVFNGPVRDLLKKFFTEYKGKLIWHNISFDAKILIFQLWMEHITDTKGMYEGLDIMTKHFDCTQVITYLATNSCAGNKLGLKYNAHEFAGNYAQDEIIDIRRISEPDLLKYNLIDCLATWYVYNKNYPILIKDQQEEAYLEIMKDSLITIIQMQLTGMPVCMDTVLTTEIELQNLSNSFNTIIVTNPIIKDVVKLLKLTFLNTDFTNRKTKAKNPDKIKPKLLENIDIEFNPGSSKQVAVLLHDVMKLPIIETTKTGLPSTDEKTLTSLINHTNNPNHKELIQAILDLGKVDKILNTFIPAFKEAQLGIDGIYYLFGSYKLGGTISNRLSSCLVGETEVQCTEGIKNLCDVRVGDTVPTHTGKVCDVLNVFDNGKQPVYKIHLNTGDTITCTSNHRLLTKSGFKSLEDMYESPQSIRRAIESSSNASISRLPQLTINSIKKKDKRKKFQSSSNDTAVNYSTRTIPKKTTLFKAINNRTSQQGYTESNKGIYQKYRCFLRKCSKAIYNLSRQVIQRAKKISWGTGIFKNFWIKKILSKITRKPKNQSSTQSRCRGIFRRQRVHSSANSSMDATRNTVLLSTPSSNVKSIGVRDFTKRLCSSSCKRGQDRQQIRQSSFNDSSSTYSASPRKFASIIKIEYVGIRRVYDLEIETDHCYIANNIYVHNSDPNLQNLPSGSTYGKLIKACFKAGFGWIFAGADFASLEDRINALLTKDINKLRVYTDGFDGHSLRAYSYFGNEMPDIVDTVESINSIAKVYPQQRQDSKAPTFALTYGGTNHTLVKNCGFTKTKAKKIETRYHALYKESDQWVYDKLKQASIDGYVTLAFGVRLRTPILKQCLWDTPKMPYEASAEGRSAGNAVSGQSYGMLTCRAANELRKRIRNSPYSYDIRISAQIHDAVYVLCTDNIDIVEWLNINLIECMEWQNLPEIQHNQVKLGAELDLFPSWADPITLPNKATQQEIINICKEHNEI